MFGWRRAGIGIVVLLACASIRSQTFPERDVSLVVPYPAGGVADHVARLIQPLYARQLGQAVRIENIPGVGGTLALPRVLAAAPDGHTQLLGAPSELVLTPLSLPSVKTRAEDFRPAALIARTPLFLLVRNDLPASTLDEFIAWTRTARPTCGSPGTGSIGHLACGRFADLTGAQVTHVPYQGGGALLSDLAGGRLDMIFFAMAGPTPAMVESGRIKVLGITQPKASPVFPRVRPLSDNPRLQGFQFDSWIGVQVPRATPDAAVARINQAVNEIVRSDTVQQEIKAAGAEAPPPMTPLDLEHFYAAEIERLRAVARTLRPAQ